MATAFSNMAASRCAVFLRRSWLGACAALLVVLGVVETAEAQTRIRRLGERIREGVQQRLPIAPLAPAPNANASATDNANRALWLRRPDVPNPTNPAVAPPQAPRAPIARSNYNSPANSNSANRVIARAVDERANRTIANTEPTSDTGPSILEVASQPADSKARLGVTVETPSVDSGRPSRPSRGAAVVRVAEGSGAAAAGLQVGDLIVSVDGRIVDDVGDFVSRLEGKQPGDQVDIRFVRDRQLDAATAIMAGPDGKLSDEAYARQIALRDPHSLAASKADANEKSLPNPATSGAVTGLGRIIGGLMGNQPTQGKPFVLQDKRDNRGASADPASRSETLPSPKNPDDFRPLIEDEAKAKANAERLKTDYDALEAPADIDMTQEESLPSPLE